MILTPPCKPINTVAVRVNILRYTLLISAMAFLLAPARDARSQPAAAHPLTFVAETQALPATATLGGDAEVIVIAYANQAAPN